MKREKFLGRVEIVVAFFLCLLAIYIFYETSGYSDIAWDRGGPPGFYPRILAIFLIILASFLIWEGFKRPARPSFPSTNRFVTFIVILALLIIFPKLLLLSGFMIGAFVFLFLIMTGLQGWKLDLSKLIKTFFSAAIVTFILLFIFMHFAKVPLPQGIFF